MERKAIPHSEIKELGEGKIEAVFSRLNVKDHDGDVTLPGAFKNGQQVRMSAYNHSSWAGALPIGKGEIVEEDDVAIFRGQFFMDTEQGRDHFSVIKALGDLAEYSYGFDILEAESGTWDGEPVRLLRSLDVHEVSPVLLGAGIGTHTAAIKQRKHPVTEAVKQLESNLRRELEDAGRSRFNADFVFVHDIEIDDGWTIFAVEDSNTFELRFWRVSYSRGAAGVALGDEAEEVEPVTTFQPKSTTPDNILTKHGRPLQQHREAVLEAAHDLVDRYTSLADADREKGRAMSSARCEQMTALADALEQDVKALRTILEEQAPEEPEADDVDGMKLWLQWQETQYRIREVAYDGV